jgi:xyloglucan-specific endo-beta-1,4-glucanase
MLSLRRIDFREMFMPGCRARSLLLVSASVFGLVGVGCDFGGASSQQTFDCPAAACSDTAQLNQTCQNGGLIQVGKYRILNNLWGISHSGIQGQQCAWNVCDTNSGIAWGTSYELLGGPASQVESYTAAILGWHFGGLTPDSGLPVQISANRNVSCTWSYRLRQDGPATQNVAYDLWLSPNEAPGSGAASDEIMIWLNRSSAGPIGTAKGIVHLEDSDWTLYQGTNSSWNVYSFVRTSNAPCATLNLMAFLNHLVDNVGLDSAKYLVGIEAGSEVFIGKGQLDTDSYSCEIE